MRAGVKGVNDRFKIDPDNFYVLKEKHRFFLKERNDQVGFRHGHIRSAFASLTYKEDLN
jgi:hypothetical protein